MKRSPANFVRDRAGNRCEYCKLPQFCSIAPFEIDHIIARKHGGDSNAENLCLACFYCNSAKGANIAGVDRDTGQIVRLFHPRRDEWEGHFLWYGSILVAKTSIARATLEMNEHYAVELRRLCMDDGAFWS